MSCSPVATRCGCSIRLIEQVHGETDGSKMLDREAELIRADVRDKAAVAGALKDVDSVIHLAAEVGVGQSDVRGGALYVDVNDVGTAVLFEALIDQPVRRVVTASSMSIYGEGLYHDADGADVEDAERRGLRDGLSNWEPVDAAGPPADPGRDAREEAAEPRLDLCAQQIRAGAHDATSWPAPMGWKACACASSTSTGRARRSPIPIPACSRSSPRACSTASRR